MEKVKLGIGVEKAYCRISRKGKNSSFHERKRMVNFPTTSREKFASLVREKYASGGIEISAIQQASRNMSNIFVFGEEACCHHTNLVVSSGCEIKQVNYSGKTFNDAFAKIING